MREQLVQLRCLTYDENGIRKRFIEPGARDRHERPATL